MDATGAGDPIYDDLARVWPRIEPVKFTKQTKTELIQRLIVATEQRQVSWPAAWEILTNELMRFEYAVSSNGPITYNAPSGFHDDCVIAISLVSHARYQFSPRPFVQLLPRALRNRTLNPNSREIAAW